MNVTNCEDISIVLVQRTCVNMCTGIYESHETEQPTHT